MSLVPSGAVYPITLQWRHNERVGVSNHQHRDCLINRLFKRRSKKTPKLCVTGLWGGNSPVTGEFPAQRPSNAENVSIWWRHHCYRSCAYIRNTDLAITVPADDLADNRDNSGMPAAGTAPDNKVHGAYMGPIWGRQDPGGPHVGPMNFAIWGAHDNARYNLFEVSWTRFPWISDVIHNGRRDPARSRGVSRRTAVTTELWI